jgi:serine/threonine-protein kinase
MLNQPEPKAIPGTQGDEVYGPFFSPDGEWVGFFADGTLKKVLLDGDSAPEDLFETPGLDRTGTWGPNGTIFFSSAAGIWQIDSSGGRAELVIEADASDRFWHIDILPDGKALLVTVHSNGSSRIAVLSLGTSELANLVEDGGTARYASSGHLVYLRNSSLVAVPFDLEALRVTGTPVPVLVDVDTQWEYAGAFALSPTGSLVYSPRQLRSLVVLDRNGLAEALPQEQKAYEFLSLRLSPDGRRLATTIDGDVWIYELSRDVLTRMTFHPAQEVNPVWSPDGQKIAFHATQSGTAGLYWKWADGTGEVEELFRTGNFARPSSWSPDGTLLAFNMGASWETDIWLADVGENEARPFGESPFDQHKAQFSPDGHWMIYVSGESGEDEIYIQAFPAGGEKHQISKSGGDYPVWGPDGKEIFYKEGTKLMAVPIQTDPEFVIGKSQMLFDGYEGVLDVFPDGQRFVMFGDDEPRINIVLNWNEELKRLAPRN